MLPINDLVVHWYGIITLHAFHLFVNARFFFFFFFFFFRNKKGDSRVAAIVPCPTISWVSPWVPLAWTGARKLRTYTHPRLYWFLELPEIAITVLVSRENSNLVCGEASTVTYQLYQTCWWFLCMKFWFILVQ